MHLIDRGEHIAYTSFLILFYRMERESTKKDVIASLLYFKRPIILLSNNPLPEDIACAYGLVHFFEHYEKKATLGFVEETQCGISLDFLPPIEEIRHNLYGIREMILLFDTKRNPIKNIRTEQTKQECKIFLTPEKGSIDPRDFSFIPGNIQYDGIITLGVTHKEALGELYEQNPDIFYELPIINIDYHKNNTLYGRDNFVKNDVSGVGEILIELLQESKRELSQSSAHCFLASLILGSDNFQSPKTSSSTFQLATYLIENGADRENIIHHIYKIHPLRIVKLLGRALLKLQENKELSVLWAYISLQDFVESRSDPKDLLLLLDQVRSYHLPEKYIILVFQRDKETFSGVLYAQNYDVYQKLYEKYPGAIQGRYYVFHKDTSFSSDCIQDIGELLEIE